MPVEDKFKNKNAEMLDWSKNNRVHLDESGNEVKFKSGAFVLPDVADIKGRYGGSVIKTRSFADHAKTFEKLKSNVPVLVMPVRLETRFYLDDDPAVLKIRVFPDEIMLDDHDPRLTEQEYETGKRFWKEHDALGARAYEEKAQLWAWFTNTVDTQRAPMIARQSKKRLKPEDLKSAEEYASVRAPLLPDMWFAAGYNGADRVLEAFSKPVKKNLAFSPDLANFQEVSNDLSIDPAVKWMFDFNLAKSSGMAIEAKLNEETIGGVEELYVVGLKLSDPEKQNGVLSTTKARALLEETLEHHLYSKGAGFVPQGLATNNTDEARSGWSAFKPDVQAMWVREFEDEGKENVSIAASENSNDDALVPQSDFPFGLPEADKNYRVLQNALGLSEASPLRRYEYREGYEQRMMKAMNTALWPVTWGECAASLLARDGKGILNKGQQDWLRKWFENNVTGGAPLPSLRIGDTPYGVLPVQSFGHMTPAKVSEDERAVLQEFLNNALALWMGHKDQLVRMDDNPQSESKPGDVFLDLMSRYPDPVRFYAQGLGYEWGWIAGWFDFVKLVTTDTEESITAEYVSNIISTDLDELGQKTFDNIHAQWGGFKALEQELYTKYTSAKRRLGMQPDNATLEERVNMLRAMLDNTRKLLNILSDHMIRGQAFESLNVSSDIFKGVMAPDVMDPAAVFTRYESAITQWPEDRLVIVDTGEETVSPLTYLTYLQNVIDVHTGEDVESISAPFIGKDAPLLYQLLYTAIERTAADNDEGVLIFGGMLGGRIPVTPAAAGIAKLNEDIDVIIAEGSADKNKVLGNVLKHHTAADLKKAAKDIRADGRKNKDNAAYPKKEMTALAKKIEALAANSRTLDEIKKKVTLPTSSRKRLGNIRTALDVLIPSTKAQLELLLQQTLGLAGWRLDAWFTSMHRARLDDLNGSGIQLGAFGWVHDLKPRALETGDADPSQGYIHTPSLNHARTAAVLRAGWSAYEDEEAHDALCVDLSSARVRRAQWLFDAVRQGQDLGDALGYRFERALHEAELDYWVMPIRHAVVELSKTEFDPLSPVVDGMELLDIWQRSDGHTTLGDKAASYFEGPAPLVSEIEDVIGEVEDAVDAMGDTALADSIHALVQGNPVRAGSSLAAINRGEVPPPEMQVAQTSRKGKTFTHRVMLLRQTQGDDLGWFKTAREHGENLRAAADREMEAMAAAFLSKPNEIIFDAAYRRADGSLSVQLSINLKDVISGDARFALGAQDVLAMIAPESESAGSVLEKWIALYLQYNRPQGAGTEDVPVILDGDNGGDVLNNTVRTRLWLDGWRNVLQAARPVEGRDFTYEQAGEDVQDAVVDIDALENAAAALVQNMQSLIDDVQALLSLENASADEMTAMLLRLVKANLPMAIPQNSDPVLLRALLQSVLDTLEKRVSQTLAANTNTPPETGARVKDARRVIQALLGKTMKGCARLRPQDSDAILASFSRSKARLDIGAGSAACNEWLEKMQYVQPALRDLNEAMLVHELDARPAGVKFMAGQWPDIAGEGWCGENPYGMSARGYMSIVAGVFKEADLKSFKTEDSYLSGLLVDEVVERLPADEEDTGIALHFDAPNTQPPQTLLLAMSPEGRSWDFELMIDTLRDTLEMAKLRTLDHIPVLDHHVPAVFADERLFAGRLVNDGEGET